MKILQNIYTIIFICLSTASSQVNTEALWGDNQLSGIQHNVEIDLAYISGNTELFNLNGLYRADYVAKSDWSGFFIWKYDRAFEKSSEDFSYKGFGHLRIAKPIKSNTHIEGFIQKEFNHFINMENRELFGFGIRLKPYKKIFLGTGFMTEMEKYQNLPKEQNFIKSTNYLNYSIIILKIFELQNIMYYQFKLKKLNDYRILWDGKFSIIGLKGISFHLNCHYRYDKNSVNPNYFEFSNGLGLQF